MSTKKMTIELWKEKIIDVENKYELKILKIKEKFNSRLNYKDDIISQLERDSNYKIEIALNGINDSLFKTQLELKERDEFIDRLVKSFKGIDDISKLLELKNEI